MEKRISYDEFQSVKRVAQACNPLIMKREKIKAKIEALAAEYKSYDAQVKALESGIKQMIGFRVEELVKKVVESGVDGKGNPTKTTKYLPTDIVTYDTEKRQYVISIAEPETIVPPTTEDSPGSDYDIDAQQEPVHETEEIDIFA